MPEADSRELAALLAPARCVPMHAKEGWTAADLYADAAQACLEALKSLLAGKPEGRALIQVAIPDREEGALLAGLSAMLKTAAREMPRFDGQVILMAPRTDAAEAARKLNADRFRLNDSVIRYTEGERLVERWREIPPAHGETSSAFQDDGVYLITGGLGGLGRLFVREILARTRSAKVVVSGRSDPSLAIRKTLEKLNEDAVRVTYRRLDLTDGEQVHRALAEIREAFGRLDGILHAAGMVSDHLLLRKDPEEFLRVLSPKVQGTWNLDAASRDFALDFFVLFSSVTSALGNAGQIDYAAGNAFMDHFAGHRNRLAASGERRGRAVSIHWPIWQDGGMRVDAAGLDQLRRSFGMRPLRARTGLQAFHHCLAVGHDRVLVLEGHGTRMREALAGKPDQVTSQAHASVASTISITLDASSRSTREPTLEFLSREISTVLKIPAHQIEPRVPFENFGIDSMLALTLVNRLEKTFGSLSKTLFFEYQNLHDLVAHFLEAHGSKLETMFGGSSEADAAAAQSALPSTDRTGAAPGIRRLGRPALASVSQPQPEGRSAPADEPIAIVGLSGRYPEAADLHQFW
ncbi:MAG TPA: SDR family NAD(P)-dependent oxidoreductase, partial [Fibrobacteria bacterium]|nr:SDR family NAD(P)-dependent oxidoreductase [Fibrobacteria bacterium]